jgi:hypothetical protein
VVKTALSDHALARAVDGVDPVAEQLAQQLAEEFGLPQLPAYFFSHDFNVFTDTWPTIQ